MGRNWLDVATEGRLLDELAQRRQRLALTRSSVTYGQAQLANSYADAYPWMDPTAVQSLVQAGVSPDLPAVQSIADIAAQQASQDGELDTQADDVPDSWFDSLVDTIGGFIKPVVRTGFTALSAPMEELQALLSAAGTALFDETKAGKYGLFSNLGENVSALLGEVTDPGQLVSDFWTNYTTKAARSGGVLALGDLIQGKSVDLGEGFLPGSYSTQTQEQPGFTGGIYGERERAKYRLTLDNQFVTPGRLIARQLVEPGTGQYQFLSGAYDFVQNIAVDPVNIVGGEISKAAKANRTFQATGLLDGLRRTVSVDDGVRYFLTHPDGQQIVRSLTDNQDVYAAFKAFGMPDMGGQGLRAAKRSAEAVDGATQFNVLSDVLGTIIREKPSARFVKRTINGIGRNEYGQLLGSGARASQADASRLGFLARTRRLGETLPVGEISVDNIDNAAIQLERWMVNAQLPEGTRGRIISQLADVADEVGFKSVTETGADALAASLVQEWGLTENRARSLTQLYPEVVEGLKTFDLDRVGNHLDVLAPLRAQVAGETVDLSPMPAMVAELTNGITLPHLREIRRATPIVKELQWLYDNNLWKGSIDGMRAVMSQVWFPLNVFRPAVTIRVNVDSQSRIAGMGYDSLFTHPIDAVAWSVAIDPDTNRWRRFSKLLKTQVEPKGTKTITGQAWEDFTWFTDSLDRGSAGWRGMPGRQATGAFVKTRFGQPGFYDGWSTKLSHMANDPVFRRVAKGLDPGDLRSIGRKIGEETGGAIASGNRFDDVAEWFWKGSGREWRLKLSRIEGRSALRTSRQAADGYLKQNFFDLLEDTTGGNPDLIDMVANGRIGKINLRASGHQNKLTKTLERSYAESAPGWIASPQTIASSQTQAGQALDHMWEAVGERLMSAPENYLSKSPTIRQMYFQRVEELMDVMPRQLQEAMVKGAKEASMGDDYLTRLASKMLKGEGSTLGFVENADGAKVFDLAKGKRQVNMLAGSWAASESKRLLYHLSDRNQLFDMLKLVFPFGDVWKNVFSSWARIISQRPQVVRRFQQGLNGVRQPSIFGEAETTPGSGEGFFHPDPVTGEEVFTYPSAWAAKLLGLPEGSLQFTGRAASLNVATATVLPGFGPAVTIPASHLLPNTPKWDDVREILLPFGPTPSPIGELLPPWAEKLTKVFAEPDPAKDRLFANTVTDTMRALLTTGRYDVKSREGQQELLDDATTKAKALYVIRGIGQASLPTSPSFQWNTTDVEGNLVPVKLLSDDYRKLIEQYDGDRGAAWTEWVQRYGVDNVLNIIAKTTSVVDRPVTEKGDAWLRAHAGLEQEFPMSIGFFAAEPAAGDFDYTAYLRSIATGAREAISPAEQLALANDFLGRIQWEQAKTLASFRPSPETSSWLALVRQQIADDYPGFDGWVSRAIWEKRPQADEMIAEITRAVQDPTLAATDAGKGAIKYLSAIAIANQMVTRLPNNTRRYQQAKSARPIRDWLRLVAKQIISEHPDFARMWTMVFERELADDSQIPLASA